MSREFSESEWRCPKARDGAFHLVDLSRGALAGTAPCTVEYLCTKCGQWIARSLVEDGMANALESQPQYAPIVNGECVTAIWGISPVSQVKGLVDFVLHRYSKTIPVTPEWLDDGHGINR